MGGDNFEKGWGTDKTGSETSETAVAMPPPLQTAPEPPVPGPGPAIAIGHCQSCGDHEAEIPVVSGSGIGLTVCKKCSTVLATIGWEIAHAGNEPA